MCPEYDGKRCKLTGFQPDELCDPVIEETYRDLRASERKSAHPVRFIFQGAEICLTVGETASLLVRISEALAYAHGAEP